MPLLNRVLVLVALLAAPIALYAADAVGLFRTPRVGMKIRYVATSRTVTETVADASKSSGEKTRGKEKGFEDRRHEYTEVVLGVKSGEGLLTERHYTNSTCESAKGNTMPKKGNEAKGGLHGKTLYVRAAPAGVWVQPRNAGLEGEDDAQLKFAEQLYVLLPTDLVKPGATWEPAAERIGGVFFGSMYDTTNFKTRAKCIYKTNEKSGGRNCARIAVQLTIDIAAHGDIPEYHQELSGILWAALDSGTILAYDLTGPLRYRGRSKDANNVDFDYDSSGTRTQTLRGEVLEDGTDLQGGTLDIPDAGK